MRKISYYSKLPIEPAPIKDSPIATNRDEMATENAGRNGWNLQEMSRDIEGVIPEEDEESYQKSLSDKQLESLTDLWISMADELDQIGEESLASIADFMIKKTAEASDNFDSDFRELLLKINTLDGPEINEKIIMLTKFYSSSLVKKNLEYGDINIAKEEALNSSIEMAEKIIGMTKTSQLREQDPNYVAEQIINIVRIMISRMSLKSRPKSFQSIRRKIYQLNPSAMSLKKAPGGAMIGVSISLIKNMLNGRDPYFITHVLREVTNKL
jgi:hypothetical protein